MEQSIVVYVIIVTFNGDNWIQKCISSALSSNCNVRLIIIDNGSTDRTLEIINSFPKEKIHFITATENLGFGKANNIGIDYAIQNGAEFVYLLNQDAYLEPDTISGLIDLAKRDSNYVILSPMQFNGDGSKLDNNFQDIYSNRTKPSNTISDVLDAEFVMAAHWLVRTSFIKEHGAFNPIFIHYGEDGDFKNRVHYHGYKLGIGKKYRGYHDREFRQVAYQKIIPQVYMNLLAHLTDPRENYNSVFNRIVRFRIKDTIIRIFKGQFDVIKIHKKYFKYIYNNRDLVKKSRQEDLSYNSRNPLKK